MSTYQSISIQNQGSDIEIISLVVEKKELVQKTKQFLKDIAQKKKAKDKEPLGIALKTADGEKVSRSAIAYERGEFVIVIPNGTEKSAKLYGNWEEALTVAQRIMSESDNSQNTTRIVLSQYIHKIL